MRLFLKITIFVLVVLVFATLVTGLVVWNRLPSLIEHRIMPYFAAEYGFSEIEVDVRRIGPGGMDFADLRIVGTEGELLRIDSVRLDYSLSGLLWGHHINNLEISGLRGAIEVTEDGISPEGGLPPEFLDLLKFGEKPEEVDEPSAFLVDGIEIRNSEISIVWGDFSEAVPVALSLGAVSSGMDSLDFDAVLTPRGKKLEISGVFDFSRNSLQAVSRAVRFPSARFADFPGSPEILSSTEINFSWQADAEFDLPTMTMNRAEVSAILHPSRLRTEEFGLITFAEPGRDSEPVALTLEFDGGVARGSMKEISLFGPEWEMDGENLVFQLTPPPSAGEDWQFETEGKLAFSDETRGIKVPSVTFQGGLQYGSDEGGSWNLAAIGDELQVEYGAGAFQFFDFSLDGNGTLTEALAELNFKIDEWHARYGDANLSGSAMEGEGKLAKNAVDFGLEMADIKMISESALFNLKGLSVKGESRSGVEVDDFMGNLMEFPLQGWLEIDSARFVEEEKDLTVEGMSGRIPLQWPLPSFAEIDTEETEEDSFIVEPDSEIGKIQVDRIVYGERQLGSFGAALGWSYQGLLFEGEGVSDFLPDLKTGFAGELRVEPDADLALEGRAWIEDWNLAQPLEIGRFLPAAEGVSITGEWNALLNFSFAEGELQLALETVGRKIDLKAPDSGLEIGNMTVLLDFPDLLEMRSAAGQMISFEKGTLGRLEFSRGIMQFRLDDPHNWFIEKAGADWAGGRVSVFSLEFDPAVTSYSFDLFCEDLELTEMMRQFDLGAAEGEGRLNGRVPIDYNEGELRLDDGFLYSTPGLNGAIKISDAGLMQGVIPEDTSGQMALTKAALKDFEYDWVKLRLSMEEETLKLKFKFDGKPAGEVMPFVFQDDIGDWVRVDAESAGSRFSEMRIDLNFTLPLNEVIGIGMDIHELFSP